MENRKSPVKLTLRPLETGRHPARDWEYGEKKGKVVLQEPTLVSWKKELGWRGVDQIAFQDAVMKAAVEWCVDKGRAEVSDIILPGDLGPGQTTFLKHLKETIFHENICPQCNHGRFVEEVVALHAEKTNIRTVRCSEHGVTWQEDHRGRRIEGTLGGG
ncbi:hypothetical protein [Candidatus Nitrospira bockiana]